MDHLRPFLELDALCRHPVFIIGSPRSGTTALGHALNRHPEFWASKESYVLHQLFGGGRVERAWKDHWERANPSWLRAEGVELEEFRGFLGLGINAMYSSRSGGRRWVDPTPLNTPMVGNLAEMLPGARFVHMLRDGRNVVRSMGKFRDSLEQARSEPMSAAEMPGWTEDFREACETWATYVETALDFERAHPSRCLTVRNEDLVREPGSEFARVFEFLEAEYDPAPGEFFSDSRINSSFRNDPSRPSDSDWSDWVPEQRQVFVEAAGPSLIRAGYASKAELEGWQGPVPHA